MTDSDQLSSFAAASGSNRGGGRSGTFVNRHPRRRRRRGTPRLEVILPFPVEEYRDLRKPTWPSSMNFFERSATICDALMNPWTVGRGSEQS
jgi:hypothetical protein